MEAVREVLIGRSNSKSSINNAKDVEINHKSEKNGHGSPLNLENGVSSKSDQESLPKLSLFQLKKNKILKDFITELRKFSSMVE